MTHVQLSPPVPLDTPKGKALAYFMIDRGIDFDLEWICAIDATGECWTFRNPHIRFITNITWGRRAATEKDKPTSCPRDGRDPFK
jgi:hypothetical protein